MKVENLGLILAVFDLACARAEGRRGSTRLETRNDSDDSAGALMAVPLQVTSPDH